LKKRIRESEILKSSVTLHGRVAHDEMPNFYGAADLFVSGSHSEGSGYALIEAMASGVVPVVTDIPSFRSIVGNCGRRWAPGDSRGLATRPLGGLERAGT
jgi:glycosyltransferase involved in cell wall biosynthesis